MRNRLGAPKAITAMAHMLGRLTYRMLKFGEEYVDKGAQYYEEKLREQTLKKLHRDAAALGMVIVAKG